jgi:membrane associated rhomboid family serine protease
MGIYDREYYRNEGPSFLDSITSRGMVCKWLIIINVIVFTIQLVTHPGGRAASPFTDALVLDVGDVQNGQVWRLLTYSFLHSEGALLHILFNMLFLWWFGSELEAIYGPREFLAIYLAGALTGGLAFLAHKWSVPSAGCLGASAAVTAVLVIYAFHFPGRTIWLFFVLPIPIWLFVLFSVLQDLVGLLGGAPARSVAFSGHLGGAAFGAAYFLWGGRLLNLVPDFKSWMKQRRRPRLRIYREDEPPREPVTTRGSPDVDEQLEAKLDAVLAKWNESGEGSLTESEREFLIKASEVCRKRREKKMQK